MRLFLFLLLQVLIFLPLTSFAVEGGKTLPIQNRKIPVVAEAQKAGVIKKYGKLPLYFIENKGQVDEKVSFYEKGAGHATFFTNNGVVIGLTKKEGKAGNNFRYREIKDINKPQAEMAVSEALTLSFIEANPKAKIIADNKQPGHANYFIGNDKSKWRSNIPTYGAVTYKEIYKNIDIKFYGNNRKLEHDVIVRPGGNILNVKFSYAGVLGVKVTEEGNLEVSLKGGRIIEQKPIIYQEIAGKRVIIKGSFRIIKSNNKNFAYGFDVASYDHSKTIVIDPVLIYSTYLGGFDRDAGFDIASDPDGNVYVTGITVCCLFPVINPIMGNDGGVGDAFVLKADMAGILVYSTFLGGSEYDSGQSIAIDTTGAAYVAGMSKSIDFPVVNPIQSTHRGTGTNDAFITKLNPTGSAIIYSTYLGGTVQDAALGIAVNSGGEAYITGYTSSSNFPLLNPLQGTGGGITDAFISKLNSAGSALVYSTLLGGFGANYGNGIAVGLDGSAYVVGYTSAENFPLAYPLQGSKGGLEDAFISKLNPTGSALVFSTYLGGSDNDRGNDIAVDITNDVYLTGNTASRDFPVVNAIQPLYGLNDDAFVAKIDGMASSYIYSTFLGGFLHDYGYGISFDSVGAAYVTGQTNSFDFPSMNPMQMDLGGGYDAFVTRIDPSGSIYLYSTFFGGSGDDAGRSIAVDYLLGDAFIVGDTGSMDFPVIGFPVQPIYGGGLTDAFIADIFELPPPPPPPTTIVIRADSNTVASGGVLGYYVRATNTDVTQQCFDYWENVTLPNLVVFPKQGELFGPSHLCLDAGAVKTVHLTHDVPIFAPVGAYVFNVYIGTYPTPVLSEAHFNFNVIALGPVTNHRATSWRLIENGFKK